MRRRLRRFVDEARVRAALVQAEALTDAPIVVSLAPHFWGDVQRAAHRALRRHGMTKHPARGGVLFLVVPSRREFAVVGDAGAHAKLGQTTWDAVAALVEEHFRRGDPTGGLIAGIDELGRALARHFPRGGAESQA